MPTTLMKTCLFGMAGVMTIGLAACGGNSSSTDTSASATSGRASATASQTPTEHKQSEALKRLSKDDFTKAISDKKIDNQTFTVVDSPQLATQVDQVTKVISQAKISPADCGTILKQSTTGVTSSEIKNVVAAVAGTQSAPIVVNFNAAMSNRQKKMYGAENEQFSKCGHVTMELQGHKTKTTMKVTPIKGYEAISKRASLYTTATSNDNGPEVPSYQAYVWLKDDQLIQTTARDAKTAQSTLKSALDALGIAAK